MYRTRIMHAQDYSSRATLTFTTAAIDSGLVVLQVFSDIKMTHLLATLWLRGMQKSSLMHSNTVPDVAVFIYVANFDRWPV